MSKNIPLLTIGVPTYRRPGTLRKIIEQLLAEKNQNFTLLISDDSMDDATENMVKKYLHSMPNLVYIKNKKNLGFSGNVAHLYDLATTRYVWFLCDDDSVISGAIDNIIKALKKYEPVVAVFNAIWTDSFGRKRIAGVDQDVIYDNINNFKNYQSLTRTTFLSIVVVEKRISVATIKSRAYTDNVFFQLTLSLLLLSNKFKYCQIAYPIVKRNVGYKYGDFFKFYLVDHLKAITLMEHKFDNKKFVAWSVRNIPTALLLFLSQKVGLFRYTGSPTKETKRLIIKYYGFYSIFIALFVVIYYGTPKFLLKFLYLIRLITIHGYYDGLEVYRKNVDRALKDKRITGFTTYR